MLDKKVVVITSGGMDSTAAVYWTCKELHPDPLLLSFQYGQRHGDKELACAQHTAHKLGLHHHIIDLWDINELTQSSALTNAKKEIPEGHYAEDTMKDTVVPNRNMMFLSIAYAAAVSLNAEWVVTGVHAGDHAVYPDCRPEFIKAFNACAKTANEGFGAPDLRVVAPFQHMTKAGIAAVGDELGVEWANTWSCYKGGEVHCGRCSTCVERLEAFDLADVVDHTRYADRDYWKEVV
jgi:7-cyano-7-deazaguanine synthase